MYVYKLGALKHNVVPSMNIYRQSRGRYQWWSFFLPQFCFERGHTRVQGQDEKTIQDRRRWRRRRQRGKSSDNDCHLFFFTSQSTLFFTTKEFFPYTPHPWEERDLQCILCMCVYIYIREMAKHDNWEAKRVLCVCVCRNNIIIS